MRTKASVKIPSGELVLLNTSGKPIHGYTGSLSCNASHPDVRGPRPEPILDNKATDR